MQMNLKINILFSVIIPTKQGDVKSVAEVFTKEVGRHSKRTIVGGREKTFSCGRETDEYQTGYEEST